MAILDSHPNHLAGLAAFTLAQPLAITLAAPHLVFHLPEHLQQ